MAIPLKRNFLDSQVAETGVLRGDPRHILKE
jgi:hypothetical protein